MCWCNPQIRTPCCGKLGCVPQSFVTQADLMKFDPATGESRPYPSHADQWRKWNGASTAWLFNPWTGRVRDARDVGSDPQGHLIVTPLLVNVIGTAKPLTQET